MAGPSAKPPEGATSPARPPWGAFLRPRPTGVEPHSFGIRHSALLLCQEGKAQAFAVFEVGPGDGAGEAADKCVAMAELASTTV